MRLVVSMLCALASAAPLPALATTQVRDQAVVEGAKGSVYGMVPDVPFVSTHWRVTRPHPDPESDAAFARLQPYLRPGMSCSAAARGYNATWEVRGDKLWLVRLTFDPCGDAPPVPISVLFPDATDGAFAGWASGKLIVTIGPWTRDVGAHAHVDAYWEIVVDKGVVVSRERIAKPFRL